MNETSKAAPHIRLSTVYNITTAIVTALMVIRLERLEPLSDIPASLLAEADHVLIVLVTGVDFLTWA